MRLTSNPSTIFASVFFLLAVSGSLMGCAHTETKAQTNRDAKTSLPPALSKTVFAESRGCFLLYDMKKDAFVKVVGEEICRERFVAASTFKVPLAVMAFDSGALRDEKQILKWDGKKESRPELNQDHDARTWMRDSVVWFSKRLTPKIGLSKIQKYLRDFKYGNEDMSGGLKEAWLVSPGLPEPALRISAYEQVEFLKNLWRDLLPVSKRSMQLTREITFLETSPQGYRLNGKTGSNFFDRERTKHLGWFVGHIEKEGQEYLVATVFSDLDPSIEPGFGGPRAKQMTKDWLASENLW